MCTFCNPPSRYAIRYWTNGVAPPLVELVGGMAGHLLAWKRHERHGSWWAWVS